MDNAEPTLSLPGETIRKQVVWLAAPVAIEQALLYLVGVSDAILTGRFFSAEYLAAVTVAGYLLWFVLSILTIVSVGATALVARLRGANDRPSASRVAQQAVGLAMVLGCLVLSLGWFLAGPVVALMNLEGKAADLAALYLRIVLCVFPLQASATAGIACLRGAGDTRTGMWVMTVVNVVNISLSWVFVVGLGPFPRLGFSGIAVGTAVAEGVGGLIVLGLLSRGRSGLQLVPSGFRPVWEDLRRMLRVSIPAAGESLTNVLGQLWFLSVITRLGSVATAAHGVAIRCEAIAFLTITAFAVASSTLTGQYLGAGRPDLAARASKVAWGLGTLALILLGGLICLMAEPMFALFLGGKQPAVAEAGIPVLRLVAFALPALATISVLCGTLRGAGDTRWPWVIVLLGYAGVRLPLAYLFTRSALDGGLGWGLYGAWVAMFVDLYVRGALIAARFFQGGWRRVRV